MINQKYTVLIVDDVPENIQVLSGILYQQGLNISIAQSGKEAFDHVRRKLPDLILLDIIMPDMDGFEVCAQLKQNPATKEIPIIFLTAKAQIEDIVKGFTLGAVDYVTKPFNPTELLARVFTHLDLKHARDLINTQNQQLEAQNVELDHQNKELQELYTLKEQYFSDALRASEERFRTLVENQGEGVGIIDTEERFTFANPAAHRIFGVPAGTLVGRNLQEFLEPEQFERIHAQAEHYQQGETRTYECEVVGPHGEQCDLLITATPQFNRTHQYIGTIRIFRDITERKHAEEALRRSECQYRFLAENVADGIGIIQEGNLVFVNEALASMLGFPAEHLLGNPLIDLVHEDYKTALEQTHQQIEMGTFDPQWHTLQCMIRGDGREFWIEGRHSAIEWEGHPAILMSMRDISHQKFRELQMEAEQESLRKENLQLKSTIKERYRFGDLVGKSLAMQEVYELILKAANTDANVIIYGESGTGKELVAHTIHRLSRRQKKPFVPFNCGAIQETLFESEFFGHRKGSFTGAYQDQEGLFDRACGGSLFLDEVGELTPGMQAKLLRAIEGGEYTPVGGNKIKRTDVRIIAATHRNLPEQVELGLMRADFFYRMYIIMITIPPLHKRREDIPLLVDFFLKKYSENEQIPELSGRILNALYDYDWPGNVRELQNTIQRFLATGRLDFISARKIELSDHGEEFDRLDVDQEQLPLPEALDSFEKRLILSMLNRNLWNKSKTAKRLGITRRSLIRRIEKYRLKPHTI